MNRIYYKNILEEQKFEISKLIGNNYIPRDIENSIKSNLNSKLIKVISGPQRAGKSVLSLRLINDLNFAYINLINALAVNAIESPGRLIENIVFLHLRRNFSDIYYANLDNKHEVDFIVREGINFKKLIQVSYILENQKTINREYTALIDGSKRLKTDELIIVSYDSENEEIYNNKKIKVIPIWKYLLES